MGKISAVATPFVRPSFTGHSINNIELLFFFIQQTEDHHGVGWIEVTAYKYQLIGGKLLASGKVMGRQMECSLTAMGKEASLLAPSWRISYRIRMVVAGNIVSTYPLHLAMTEIFFHYSSISTKNLLSFTILLFDFVVISHKTFPFELFSAEGSEIFRMLLFESNPLYHLACALRLALWREQRNKQERLVVTARKYLGIGSKKCTKEHRPKSTRFFCNSYRKSIHDVLCSAGKWNIQNGKI